MKSCREPGIEPVVDRLQPGEEDAGGADVLACAHSVLGVLGLLGARKGHLQTRVVEESLVVRGVERSGADVSADHQGERLVGPDHSLIGAPDRQVCAGTERGGGRQATDRQQRAPRGSAAARCLSIWAIRVVVRSKYLRCVLGGDLVLLKKGRI